MRTSIVILLAASLLLVSYGKSATSEVILSAQDEGFAPGDAQVGDEAPFEGERLGGQDPQYDEKFIEAQRNKLWGCFFLVKQKVYSITPELQTVLSNTKEIGLKVYNKIIGNLFTGCIMQIQPEEGQQVLNNMGNKDFNLEEWDNYIKFDIENYKNPENVDTTLNPDEEAFLNYYNEMDKQLRERYGGQEGQEGQEEGFENVFNRRVDTEPKIGGFSVKEMSSSTRFFYLVVIFSVIGGCFYYAYNKLFNQPESAYEKVKKQKKDKKRDKSQ